MVALLRLLGGAIGPYVVGAVAAVMATMLVFGGVQTIRLSHAKRDIEKADAITALAQAKLVQCHDNTAALQASLDGQNRAVDQMKADSDKRLQASSDALHGAEKGRESAEARAAKLLALKPAGIDACARMMDADRAVLESLH